MRTDRKSKAYFEHYLELEKDDCDYFEQALQNRAVEEEMIPSVKRKLFTQSLQLWIAKYSMGAAVEELKAAFSEVLTRFQSGWKDRGNTPEDIIHFDNYILMLWMLSLGVLLDVEQGDFEKIVDVLDRSNREDYLFDSIIAYRIPKRLITAKMTYPNQFMFLQELISTKNVSELKNYLGKSWYVSMKPTYWYNNHKSKRDTFFGYWSFESAVFIKIDGLDDAIIKDQEYYPYDLVHQEQQK